MINQSFKNILFIALSLLFLALGLVGVSRQSLRAGKPFEWEERGNQVVITKIYPDGAALKAGVEKGDCLLKIDGHPLKSGKEFEFFLDTHKSGQNVSFTFKRIEKEFSISFILVQRYNTRFIILNLFLGLLFWLVGIFVYLNKPTERAVRVFFWGFMIISVSVMMFWRGYPYDAKFAGYLLSGLYFLLYPLVPAIILYFSVLYPAEKRILQKYKFLTVALFIPSFGFIILLESIHLSVIRFQSLETYQSCRYIYTWFQAYLIFYLMISIGCLIHSYKLSITRESRNRIQWILWGICIGSAPFLFLWSIPHVLDFSPVIPEEVNYIFIMIIPLAFAFSIVKYRAMNIEILINRSIVYGLVTGVIVILYLTSVGLAGHVLYTVSPRTGSFLAIFCTLIAAALFSPIKRRMQAFVDKTFFRVKYNYQLAIQNFSKALASAYDPDELAYLIVGEINNAIPVEKVALMLRSSSGRMFNVRGNQGLTEEEKKELRFKSNSNLVQVADSQSFPMVKRNRADIKNVNELPEEAVLDRIGIELLIPITLQEQLIGFLALGKKLSGTRYSEEDLELLIPMSEEGFMALERLRLQEKVILERAEREKFEEMNKLKSEFVSHVSHELRTPLTSIRWSAENMLDGIPEKLSPKLHTYIAGILDSSLHLNQMIENLLDITKIEAGKIEIYTKRLNVSEEIQKILLLLKPLAEKKDIRLGKIADEDLWVEADRDWFQAILTNLLDNAIKYSAEGEDVQVEAKFDTKEKVKKTKDKRGEMVAISVVDHGIGISKEKQKVVFGRFGRIKKEKIEREHGLGLGLFIVKKLVELQGGRIWMESEEGKGSLFTFTLPRG